MGLYVPPGTTGYCRPVFPGFFTFAQWFVIERLVNAELSNAKKNPNIKWECQEIFAFFSWIKNIWAPDKQVKMVFLKN